MAFKEFTNRSVQYPFRRKLTLVAGTTDVYEVTKTGVEGTVFADGVMFNEANMGEMQDEIVNYVNGTALWTNPSPLTAFAEQVVSLVGNLSDYESYEIMYAFQETANSTVFRTGKIPVARNTELMYSAGENLYRYIASNGSTSLTFSDCQSFPLNGGASSIINARLIPLKVIGYK